MLVMRVSNAPGTGEPFSSSSSFWRGGGENLGSYAHNLKKNWRGAGFAGYRQRNECYGRYYAAARLPKRRLQRPFFLDSSWTLLVIAVSAAFIRMSSSCIAFNLVCLNRVITNDERAIGAAAAGSFLPPVD